MAALLKAGKKEPAGLARCIAISSLGIFLYEELSHGTMHQKSKETINVLLATLRVSIEIRLILVIRLPICWRIFFLFDSNPNKNH